VERLVFGSFVTSDLISALAEIVWAAQIGTADVSSGLPYLLFYLRGGVPWRHRIRAGRVNVLGTLVAIFPLATGVTGLQLAGARVKVEDLFNGVALIVAVALAVPSGPLLHRHHRCAARTRCRGADRGSRRHVDRHRARR
jgi:ribose transport system permease protein